MREYPYIVTYKVAFGSYQAPVDVDVDVRAASRPSALTQAWLKLFVDHVDTGLLASVNSVQVLHVRRTEGVK
jgi:hypothetical protein